MVKSSRVVKPQWTMPMEWKMGQETYGKKTKRDRTHTKESHLSSK
jgi:hypothetical protein